MTRWLDPEPRGVLALQGPGGLVDHDEEKLSMLLQTFFPPKPKPENGELNNNRESSPAEPFKKITEAEIRRAIFRSDPKKAPGPDEIPFLVWQKI